MSFDPVFNSLLIHTCSIVEAGTQNAGYGHGAAVDWSNPTAVTTGVAFRLMPRDGDSRFAAELQSQSSAGTVVAMWLGFMQYDDAPDHFLDKNASLKFRIVDVLNADGSSVDAGPFDIRHITRVSGEAHHLELSLRRVS